MTSAVDNADVTREVRMVVDIDETDLIGEYASVSHHMARWGERYAVAQEAYLKAKLGRERSEARLRLGLREDWEADPKNKRCTEAQLDALVKGHDHYAAAKVCEIEAEAKALSVRSVLNAIKAKADMLISLGAAQRAEMRAS